MLKGTEYNRVPSGTIRNITWTCTAICSPDPAIAQGPGPLRLFVWVDAEVKVHISSGVISTLAPLTPLAAKVVPVFWTET